MMRNSLQFLPRHAPVLRIAASAAALLLAATGCTLFRMEDDTVKPDPNPVASKRMDQIRRDGIFRCAYVPGVSPKIRKDPATGSAAGPEAELLRAKAKALDLNVSFVEISPARLPGAVRSGQVDLAAAGLTEEQVRGYYLEPVKLTSGSIEGIFMMRRNDSDFRDLLLTPAPTPEPAQ